MPELKALHYIIIVAIFIYLLSGVIFAYFSLQYRKTFRRIRKASNILLRDLNEELAGIKHTMEDDGVELRFKPFEFASDSDDFIEQNRDQVYTTIDKALEKARKYFTELTDEDKIDAIASKIANLDNNMTNYRRLVLKHNKIVDNYNFNARSIIFVVFAAMIGMKIEEHI